MARHLDLEARALEDRDQGYYTIASAERWQGIDSREAIVARQASDPLILCMGRTEQAESSTYRPAPVHRRARARYACGRSDFQETSPSFSTGREASGRQ